MFKVLWELINGKKFSTGSIMILAVLVLKQFGIDNDQATQLATQIMLGIGAIITVVGYIHKWVKVNPANKK